MRDEECLLLGAAMNLTHLNELLWTVVALCMIEGYVREWIERRRSKE